MRRKGILLLTGVVLGIGETIIGWFLAPVNFLGYFLVFIGLCYCLGGSIFLAVTQPQSEDKPQQERNVRSDHTLLMLAPGALLVLLAVPLEYALLPETLPRTRVMQWAGLAIILLGFALRIWVRRSLKEAYQGNLQVRPNQHLITSGPYYWVRHPGYLGFIVAAAGLVIGFSSLIGMLGVALLTAGFLLRSLVEERMLIQAFGEQYILYAKCTGRMMPRFRTASQNRTTGRKIE